MINEGSEHILDEARHHDVAALWLDNIRAKRQFWLRWCGWCGLIFGICFGTNIFVAYRYVPSDLVRIFGVSDVNQAQGLFVVVFFMSIISFICLVVGIMRQSALPYLPTWSEVECRAHAQGRMRVAFALALVLLGAPAWLYFNYSLTDFGNFIGVPPGRQSGGTSEVLSIVSGLLGLLSLWRAAVYARRRTYTHPTPKI